MIRPLCVLLAMAGFTVSAADGPAGLPEGYGLIVTRNIFDPNRRPYVAPPPRPAFRPPPAAPPAPPEVIYLAGAVISAADTVALFDGSKPEFRIAASKGDEIGGLTVREVRTTGVSLAAGDVTLRLAVGESLRRNGSDSTWVVSTDGFKPTGQPAAGPSRPAASAGSGTASAGGGTSAPPSDLMQKLLERRKRELGQ